MFDSSWFASVDLYCERAGPHFWAEPVNAVTNAAFLVAAAVAFVEWRRAGGRDWPALALIGVVVMVGIGSFLFHTFATRWAALADTLPIAAFIYGYLLLALVRFLRLRLWSALALLVGFAVLSYGVPRLMPGILPGALAAYVPALLAMIALGLLAREQRAGRRLLATAGVFALSLSFRTVDLALCEMVPFGTHFLWHILNALVLYLLLNAAIHARSQERLS